MPSPAPQLFDYPLAVIDVETTGISHLRGGVIDIGVLRIEHGQIVETFQQLINPGVTIPAFISQLTGITNEDLADAPVFADVAKQLQDILQDCIFVAHNARFDYSFIKEEFRRQDIRYAPKTLCTVKLSRGLYPDQRHHKLDALIERFHISIADRHRAFGDAQATWQALAKMVEEAPADRLAHLVKQQLRQPTLPPQLPKQIIDDLPTGPGVYIFENAAGAPLYVGKSINIKTRVLSHFSDDIHSPKEMQLSQDTTHIRTIPTAGELGALIKESELIKTLIPIYNRALRRKTELVLALQSRNQHGFPTIKAERHGQAKIELQLAEFGTRNTEYLTDSIAIESVAAVFQSERQAKESLLQLAKEYHLCHKLLGLQKTSGACFAHQLKICRGACVGKETPLDYEQRLNQAFTKLRLQRWPYPGPILVTEHRPDQQSATSYIIDQWRISTVIERRDQDTTTIQLESTFDLDQYKILRRFLSQAHPHTTLNMLQTSDVPAIAMDF